MSVKPNGVLLHAWAMFLAVALGVAFGPLWTVGFAGFMFVVVLTVA